MPNVLLVSSNPDNPAPEDKFDLYVHFNGGINFDKTPADKSMLIVRSRKLCAKTEGQHCHQVCPENCYQKIGSCTPDCKISGNPRLIVVMGKNNFKGDPSIEVLDRLDVKNLNYPKDKSPTTGFIAVKYFLQLGYNVNVLGFDLSALNRNSKVHDFDYEINEINKMISQKVIGSV